MHITYSHITRTTSEIAHISQNNATSGGFVFKTQSRGGFKRTGSKYFCSYYKILGNSYECCFKVHGFPSGIKGFQDKKTATVASSSEPFQHSDTKSPSLTSKQYTQLLDLLNKQHQQLQSDPSESQQPTSDSNDKSAHASFAGHKYYYNS
ncbi:Bis(5'-nucleosyl)-tetraphosphatase symmetrical [Bienertia sinuspersici]